MKKLFSLFVVLGLVIAGCGKGEDVKVPDDVDEEGLGTLDIDEGEEIEPGTGEGDTEGGEAKTGEGGEAEAKTGEGGEAEAKSGEGGEAEAKSGEGGKAEAKSGEGGEAKSGDGKGTVNGGDAKKK